MTRPAPHLPGYSMTWASLPRGISRTFWLGFEMTVAPCEWAGIPYIWQIETVQARRQVTVNFGRAETLAEGHGLAESALAALLLSRALAEAWEGWRRSWRAWGRP